MRRPMSTEATHFMDSTNTKGLWRTSKKPSYLCRIMTIYMACGCI